MSPFLYQVANYIYTTHGSSLNNIRIVFPNRRSGVYFTKYLKQINDQTIWMPEILTINEFIESNSDFVKADQVELLIHLFNVYKKVTSSVELFDDFYFWGEIMLNDFNDIDKYEIDAKAILSNVRELKDIDAGFDFLTDSQLQVLKRFFSEFDPEKNSKLKENFLQIWNFLLPIYTAYNDLLDDENVAYEGKLYRNAVKSIANKNANDVECHYVFVGFNAITKCEESIFSHLQSLGKASFFWDFDDYYTKSNMFEAGYFIRNYLKKFPHAKDFVFETNNLTKEKDIQVVSTPSNNGQAAFAGKAIYQHPKSDYSTTALVLADELLLQPALSYLPAAVEHINITMGYPVKDTLAGHFIDLLVNLKLQSVKNKRGVYYKQILPLLKHPYVSAIIPDESEALIQKIKKERLLNLNAEDWDNHVFFSLLLKKVDDFKELSDNLAEILNYVQERLLDFVGDGAFQLDFEQLYNIYLLVNKLSNQLVSKGLSLSLSIYVKLLRKMIFRLRVPFEGEPVQGLQVMGFLETRNLDFEHLIILSVNDSLLPSSSTSPSFIPYSLRKGFELPTRELHDAMYAYYFYRIIQRAEKVTLVYNSSTGGLSSGDKSRFVHQLLYNKNFKVKETTEQYSFDVMVRKSIEVIKDSSIKDRLKVYLGDDSDKKLSPSALVTYLTCPLKFCYQQLLRLREDDELTESVDARLFGNIFHHAAEFIYLPFVKSSKEITKEDLHGLAKNKTLVNDAIQKAFNKTFFGEDSDRNFKVRGKNQLVFDIIQKYVFKMLQIDMKYAPFEIVGLEENLYRKIKFQNSEDEATVVNIGGQIDRIDRTSEGLRVIDYKTGADKLSFKTIDHLFDKSGIKDNKASLQTLIYSYVLSSHYPVDSSIIPGVYKVKEFFNPGFTYKITSKEVEEFQESNFKRIELQLESKLKELLEEIFDFSKPFVQTKDLKHCEYCAYNDMCGKK